MTKIPFKISATQQSGKAFIRITGTIGLETNADLFRSQVDELVSNGIKDAHLYINSQGGSCFDAAEIVNIIQSNFKGRITGEGGALVASAATYIALHCNSFSMPANGMFMIHKPSGGMEGNVKDLESYTKLLKDIENQYYNVYKAHVTDIDTLDENWNSGDWWLTAQEAKDYGFISEVKENTIIDKQTASLISACGCPIPKVPRSKDTKTEETESETLAQIIEALELSEEATIKDILEAIAKLKGEETPEKAIKNALKTGCIMAFEQNEFLTIAKTSPKTFSQLMHKRKEQAKAEQNKQINGLLTKAIQEKRIVATAKEDWRKLLEKDFNTANAALQHIEPLQKISFSRGNTTKGENRADWTLDDYRKKDPKALQKDNALYNELLEKELNKNK